MNLTWRLHWLMVVVLFAGVGAVSVWSQTKSLPDAPGTWKPWKPLSATTGSGGAKEQAAAPALVKRSKASCWRSRPSCGAPLASRLLLDSASKRGIPGRI
jgi:hypothetical protein